MAGEPMKPATNRLAGASYSVCGVSTCCSTPRLQDGDPVAHGHGLDLVVGDVHRGDAELVLEVRRSRRASARAAWRRGWTAARPSGTPRARGRSPGPSRPAGAARRTAPGLAVAGTRSRSRMSAAVLARGCRSRPLSTFAQLEARSPCCRRRSCAGRARSSGTPWRCRGRWAATSLTTRSPMRISPSVMSRARPPSAGRSTCRSPTGRRARRTRRRRSPGRAPARPPCRRRSASTRGRGRSGPCPPPGTPAHGQDGRSDLSTAGNARHTEPERVGRCYESVASR